MSESEFSHVVKLGDIGSGATKLHIAADAGQREALAKRFDLESLDVLEADLALSHDTRGVLVEGRFKAKLAQFCVATRDPVPVEMDEAVAIRFVEMPVDGGEMELDADDCDSMFHDGQGVDVGEAISQSMGLALNPYPRSAHAETVLKQAGVVSEDEAKEESGPFSALAALKDKLGKQ